jgi:penicillin-binding protein 2
VLVENAGFGARSAAPVARKVLDYFLLGKRVDKPTEPAPQPRKLSDKPEEPAPPLDEPAGEPAEPAAAPEEND